MSTSSFTICFLICFDSLFPFMSRLCNAFSLHKKSIRPCCACITGEGWKSRRWWKRSPASGWNSIRTFGRNGNRSIWRRKRSSISVAFSPSAARSTRADEAWCQVVDNRWPTVSLYVLRVLMAPYSCSNGRWCHQSERNPPPGLRPQAFGSRWPVLRRYGYEELHRLSPIQTIQSHGWNSRYSLYNDVPFQIFMLHCRGGFQVRPVPTPSNPWREFQNASKRSPSVTVLKDRVSPTGINSLIFFAQSERRANSSSSFPQSNAKRYYYPVYKSIECNGRIHVFISFRQIRLFDSAPTTGLEKGRRPDGRRQKVFRLHSHIARSRGE